MAIIATGQISVVNLSEGKSIACYITSNMPKTQIYDPNPNGDISPDWSGATKLTLTPSVFADQVALALNAPGLTITWKRKEGAGSETALTTDESASDGILTVSANKLNDISSGLLTYLCHVTYADPETNLSATVVSEITFSQIKTALNAQTVWISGEQIFKYDVSSNVSPAQITLTANVANTTVSKWQYKNSSGSWMDYPTTSDNASISNSTLNVKPAHNVFVGDCATLRVLTDVDGVTDVVTVYKVHDGAAGVSGSSPSVVYLTNENMTFVGDASGQVPSTTKTCNVVAYTGATKVTPTVGTISDMPAGMTVFKGTASNDEIPITITVAEKATLGGEGIRQGVLSVPITSPVITTLSIHWGKVNSGAAGADAVVFSIYAPNGTVFANGEGSLSLNTSAYRGATAITGTYVWKKYAGGAWTTIDEAASSTLSVDGSSVEGSASYQCTMTYDGKTYTDTITLTDKTDSYQAAIESSGGSVFKNASGTSYLVCRLYRNGSETDGVKSSVFSFTAPSAPTAGAVYYKASTTEASTRLMRYNGSAWVDVTADAAHGHKKTYTWYRMDKHGNALDDGSAFASGKVIYVDEDDVDEKTTFVCEVS